MPSEHWTKYPRTLHHPASPGVISDDKIAQDLTAFNGAEVVVTEKMDGENTSIYRDGFHARSLDSGYHEARSQIAALQGRIGYLLQEGWRVCGENVFAQHAVPYNDLPAYFLGFSVWDDVNRCLAWDDTIQEFNRLGIQPVRTLYRGPWSKTLPNEIAKDLDTTAVEGFVIRKASGFPYDSFKRHVIKWVRPNHVQTGSHWSKGPITQNKLA